MGLPRILLADDHHEMLEKVVYLLQGEFEILAAVGNGKRLIEAALRLDPDLIVTDISMPVLSGIEAVRSLKKSASRAKVIFLTVHEDPAFVAVALSAGAQGYVLKNRIFVDLIPAIRKVLQGHVFASQPVSMQ
jgi:DNA-binding NarL/FixJ family response regulator